MVVLVELIYICLQLISFDLVITIVIKCWCILFTYRLFLFIFGKTGVYFQGKYTLLLLIPTNESIAQISLITITSI